jgi:hypothetical protein
MFTPSKWGLKFPILHDFFDDFLAVNINTELDQIRPI